MGETDFMFEGSDSIGEINDKILDLKEQGAPVHLISDKYHTFKDIYQVLSVMEDIIATNGIGNQYELLNIPEFIDDEEIVPEINQINERILKQRERGSVKEISDGENTFKELYNLRYQLFSVICNHFKDCAGRSYKHHDEQDDYKFKGSFLVWLHTPKGSVAFHINDRFSELFKDISEKEAPVYDGYGQFEVIERLDTFVVSGSILNSG